MEDLLSKNLHYRSHHYSEEKFGALDSKSIQSITKLSLGRLTLWWDQWDTITHYGYTPRRQLCDEISRRNQKYFTLFISGPDGFESWKKIKVKISWHTFFREEILCELIARRKEYYAVPYSTAEFCQTKCCHSPFPLPQFPFLQGALWVWIIYGCLQFLMNSLCRFWQCCGSGSAWIRNLCWNRNFCLDPELKFRIQQKVKEQ